MKRLNSLLAISLGVAVAAGACSSNKTARADSSLVSTGGASGAGPDSGAGLDTEPSPSDFACILDGTKVRSFYLTNRFGNIGASEAVANDPNGGRYPVGTIIQLIPGEAMVKRHAGYSDATNDWEFFSLAVSASGVTINTKGTTDVLNAFGLNCLDCHKKAEPQFDFVCETTHGCDPLPFTDAQIQELQKLDPRCTADAGR